MSNVFTPREHLLMCIGSLNFIDNVINYGFVEPVDCMPI